MVQSTELDLDPRARVMYARRQTRASGESRMSWRVYCSGLALLLLAGAFLQTDRLVRPPGVTEANVQRIRPGMSLAAVETTLGRKADGRTGEFMGVHPDGTAELVHWQEGDGLVLVWVGRQGRVIHKVSDRQRQEGDPRARLRAWLGGEP